MVRNDEAVMLLRSSECVCCYGSGSDRTPSSKKPVTVIFAPKNDNVTPCLNYNVFSENLLHYVEKKLAAENGV